MRQVRAVLWDLGHTLVDWDPARVYRELLQDEDAVEAFLGGVCTMAWHARHDAGVPMAQNRITLVEAHPDKAGLIEAWETRWPDMFDGWIEGMEAIVEALESAGIPQYALTNLPAEKWPHILSTYPAIARFDAHVVSGEEKLIKPDPAIFELTKTRIAHAPGEVIFIDDRADNIEAALAAGFEGVVFENAAQVRRELGKRGLPV
ncbi:MAG: HAD family phosphatase [Oceanicaulis sp.]